MKEWKIYNVVLVLTYVNIMIFGIVSSYLGKVIVWWSLSHYITYSILLVMFNKVVKVVDFKSRGCKEYFLCNIILSLFILILGWHLSILNIKSETFIYILISQVVLVSLSFWITVYCKKNSTYNQEKNQIIKVSIKEGIEYGAEVMIERNLNDSYIQNIIKCSILTSIEFVLIIILYIIFPNVIQHSDSRIYVILFSIPIIFGFILLNEYKNRLYYEDKVYKKTTILDTVLIIVGITFLFFFAGVVYYKTGITNFYVLILPIAMLYNILNTNYKISKDYHKIFNERKKQKLRK